MIGIIDAKQNKVTIQLSHDDTSDREARSRYFTKYISHDFTSIFKPLHQVQFHPSFTRTLLRLTCNVAANARREPV